MKLSGFSLRLGKLGRVYFRTGGSSKSAPRASAPQAPAAPQPVYRNPYTLWGMMWRICLAAGFAMNIFAAYIYGEFQRFLYSCAFCAAMIFFSVRYCLRYHRAETALIQAAQLDAEAAEQRRLEEQERAETERLKKQQEAIDRLHARIAEQQAREEWKRTHATLTTSVVGVTFDNEDGTKRQQCLEEILINGYKQISLEDYEYNGEPAIRVIVDDMCIGNIAKDTVPEVMSFIDRISSASLDVSDFIADTPNGRGKRRYRAVLSLEYSIAPEEVKE
nr:MAG TPA: hypothetical protein [Caudoviricetes sp.]